MPYYSGDYYQGDNYQAGGLFKSIGKFVGGVAKKVVGATPVGMALSVVAPKLLAPSMAAPPMMRIPEPGITGAVHRLAPGGHPGYGRYRKDGGWTERKRPRMQVTNTRALKRAGRRVRGFLKIAAKLGALPISRSGKGKLFKRKRK